MNLTNQLKEKNTCAECTVNRETKRGILAVNCVEQKNSEWFCGYPCLIDFFNRIDGKAASATTQLLEKFNIKPMNQLEDE